MTIFKVQCVLNYSLNQDLYENRLDENRTAIVLLVKEKEQKKNNNNQKTGIQRRNQPGNLFQLLQPSGRTQ